VLTLTDTAKEAIHALTANGPDECGIRLSTAEPSSANGQSASVSLAVAAMPEAEDQVIEEAGARLFVQPEAAQILGDQTLDAQIDTSAQQVNFFVR
jgi:Fe-S cluster assembly iron-binding protein IscA